MHALCSGTFNSNCFKHKTRKMVFKHLKSMSRRFEILSKHFQDQAVVTSTFFSSQLDLYSSHMFRDRFEGTSIKCLLQHQLFVVVVALGSSQLNIARSTTDPEIESIKLKGQTLPLCCQFLIMLLAMVMFGLQRQLSLYMI